MRLCVWLIFASPLCTLHSLSHLLLHPPDLSLHLLCGSVRREIPCAHPRMRSLAFWSTTPLSHKAGIARELRMKMRMKKKKMGKRRTRWKCVGQKTRSWKRCWNEEGWKETPCRRKSRKRYLSWWFMNTCLKGKNEVYKRKESERMAYWRDESSSLEEDTGEMIEWRSMSQEEMDQCWKKLAEKNWGRGPGQAKGRGPKGRLTEVEAPHLNGSVCDEAKKTGDENGEKTAGQ